MQVQHGSVSVPLQNPTVPVVVALDAPVPVGKSWPRITHTSSWTQGHTFVTPAVKLTGEVNGYYTQIQFEWGGIFNQAVTIKWQVITGQEFTVQSGTTNLTGLTATTAIDEIDQSETFISMSFTPDNAVNYLGAYRARAYFSTSDQITFARKYADAEGDPVYIYWYAVTMAGANVISGNTTVENNTQFSTATIAEVDLTRSFLIFSYDAHTDRYARYECLEGRFNSATQLEFRRNATEVPSSNDLTASWFVVQHDKTKVQSGQFVINVGDTSVKEIDITAIDLSRSLALVSARNTDGSDTDSLSISVAAELSATKISLQQLATVGQTTATWFAVEWVAALAPENLRPYTSVIPDEPNAFTWTPPEPQVDYEIEYREVGEATWQTTGKINSSISRHVFPANTFAIGKDYEWRVRYWIASDPDPSDFSQPVQFDTYNPVIQNPVPVPDTSLRVDIIQLGGRVKSPYGRDVQLTIEIASDAEFTSPTTYTLPAVESGEQAIVDHAVTEGGTWYIRMTATDTESLQTVLVYSFFAGQFLLFVDAPNVQTQAPQATHVTVRVKGTTTEYTAVITPAPPPEKVIERLIEIESGTVAQCQEVAERLLARWGREQRSVSGTVDLIVTLKYQQKVRVKHPPAGIDEELILQKKEHDVLGSQTTHVTLGDIILSDDELLTRILDELSG